LPEVVPARVSDSEGNDHGFFELIDAKAPRPPGARPP